MTDHRSRAHPPIEYPTHTSLCGPLTPQPKPAPHTTPHTNLLCRQSAEAIQRNAALLVATFDACSPPEPQTHTINVALEIISNSMGYLCDVMATTIVEPEEPSP